MEVIRVEEGLWHWAGPTRENADGSTPAGSIYFEGPDALVIIDPVVPDTPHAERFWKALDADVARMGLQPVAIVTGAAHDHGVTAFETRYGALTQRAWQSSGDSREETSRVPQRLPEGVALFGCGLTDERAIWIEQHRALVTGSFLQGVDGASLVLAAHNPATATSERCREFLALTRLAPRHVLTCSGRPVVDVGDVALRTALG